MPVTDTSSSFTMGMRPNRLSFTSAESNFESLKQEFRKTSNLPRFSKS